MGTVNLLPTELWAIVGDMLFCDVVPTEDGEIELLLRPAQFYSLRFDEENEMYINDCALT